MKRLQPKSPREIGRSGSSARPEPSRWTAPTDAERRKMHAAAAGEDVTLRPDVHAMEIRNDAEMDNAWAEWMRHVDAGRIG